MALVILQTSRPRGLSGTYLSGVSILNTGGRLALSSAGYRVSAMALNSLATMRGRTQKVNSVDDRVGVIIENIKKGEKSPIVHVFAGQAVTDFCGDGWCVDPRDWEGEVDALHGHILRNVRYTLDAVGYDTYRSAERTIQIAFGDCDDIAALSGAAFRAIGYHVKVKVIKTAGNQDFHHVYILVGLPPENPRSWIPVDPAFYQSPGEEAAGIREQKIYEID